jgi:Fur family zinc uptake transcriptional regulator
MTVAQIAADQQQNSIVRTGALAVSHSERATLAIAESEAICRGRGARMTPIRRRVLEALHASPKPMGAYELADVLAPRGHRIAPITVYRALDFLIDQGLAHRLASLNAYIASQPGSTAHHASAFLICEGCGSVNEITSPEVAETVMGILTKQGFKSRAKVLEITGRCTGCNDVH